MSWSRLPLRILDNRLGRVPRPSWATYLVCDRCNARCSMCDSWKLPRGEELSPSQVREVFSKLGSLDVVRLSGGEPFLRRDFADLAEAVVAESRPAVLHVTTNGSLPKRVEAFARGFSAPRRLRFMVSFDGLAPTHDRNRGRRVTFDLAMRTVHALVDLRHRGLEVSINHTVIDEQSMRDAQTLRDLVRPLDVDVHAVLAYEDSAMYGAERRGTKARDLIVLDGYPLHPNLRGVDAVGFVEEERRRLHQIRDLPTRLGKQYYLEGLEARLEGEASPRPRPRCTALRSHVRLLPNGDVPVCQFNTEVVGNLVREDFDQIWHRQANAARAWVDACGGCWAECEVMPSALYGGDIISQQFRHLRARLGGVGSEACAPSRRGPSQSG